MGIIGSIIIGILAGFLAGKILKGSGFGLIVNLLGLSVNGVIGSLVMSTIGAIVLLWIVSLFKRE